MKRLLFRFVRLMAGLFLFAAGITLTIQANIGKAPWDVLHDGISIVTGMKIGQANVVTAVVVISISVFLLKEKIGIGSILNGLLIGTFIDFYIGFGLIPAMPQGSLAGYIMMFAGFLVLSVASYLYIGSGFYAGPRDLLMVSLTKRTGLPLGITRNSIELLAFLVGVLLHGQYGWGTLLYALGLGPVMQTVFKFFRFDVKTIKQDSLFDTIREIAGYLRKNPDASPAKDLSPEEDLLPPEEQAPPAPARVIPDEE